SAEWWSGAPPFTGPARRLAGFRRRTAAAHLGLIRGIARSQYPSPNRGNRARLASSAEPPSRAVRPPHPRPRRSSRSRAAAASRCRARRQAAPRPKCELWSTEPVVGVSRGWAFADFGEAPLRRANGPGEAVNARALRTDHRAEPASKRTRPALVINSWRPGA